MKRRIICFALFLVLLLAGCANTVEEEQTVSNVPKYLTRINFYTSGGSLLDQYRIQYDLSGLPVKISSGIQDDELFEIPLGGAPVIPDGVKLNEADASFQAILLAPCDDGTALLVAGTAQEPLWGMVLSGSDFTEHNGYLTKVTDASGNYIALFYSTISSATDKEGSPDDTSFAVTEDSAYFGYDAVLTTLGNAIRAKDNDEPATLNDMLFSPLYSSEPRTSNIGYTFMDLDGDGTQELIVGSSAQANRPVVYDLYTIYNGRIVNVLSGTETAKHTLSTGNEILVDTKNDDGKTVFAAFSYYNSSVRLLEAVVQGGGERFHTTESFNNEDSFEPINYTEAQAITEKYIPAEYELTPLADYMTETGITPAE